jgi:hypothetical protein
MGNVHSMFYVSSSVVKVERGRSTARSAGGSWPG